MKSIHANSIPNGTKIVAIHYDGSGASLFYVSLDGYLYDSDMNKIGYAPDAYLQEAGYGYWMPIPNTFKLWGERE